ncbi:MAG: hypothetical protein AB9866_16600 [Syntrophobacteraceae bacterium]
MIIDANILERTCKDMIETILFCLRDATKGTIYRIGPMPGLQTVRVTTGVRDETTGEILWGLPESSDYNLPGKGWEQYKDRPGRVLEAMAWCVEKGKSWTADDPYEDIRSVRKQLRNEVEDHHHMEPVLIRKSYLYGEQIDNLDYPLDYRGEPIWRDCEALVVAVIKIHFKTGFIKRGDYSTKVIKKLSRTLGTQLLSLHIRESLSEAQKELARQRLQSCNVLAHELRNTLIKLGFIFSAINAEISFLREQWESQIALAFPDMESKRTILDRLTQLINSNRPGPGSSSALTQLCETLIAEQHELANLSLMPGLGEKWLDNKIRPKWCKLLGESNAWEQSHEEIESLLSRLQNAMWLGMDERLAQRLEHLPKDLRSTWPKLAYVDFTVDKIVLLEEILKLLDHPGLKIPHKQQTKKVLTSLKALVEMIPEVEERTNRIILSLKNGGTFEKI